MKCFVIMPFAPEFDDVYQQIKLAVEGSVPGGVTCLRLDEIRGAGRITDDLLRELKEATVCVADLSDHKPNVMWEVGYAMALGKPLLLLTQEIASLPFDLKDMRTIPYKRTSLKSTLGVPLAEAFRDTLGRYEVRVDARRVTSAPKLGSTMAVTGSMQVNGTRCRRRVETVLQPYLASGAKWLCGSFGGADEVVLEYLGEHEQEVLVIGYHAYDISPRVLTLIEKYNFSFLDASQEQVPTGLEAPSVRDAIFLTRADLLVALWADKSQGIRDLIAWYNARGRDYVVAFV